MILSDFSVRHPVIISILVIVLLVFGALAYVNLNREMMPPMGLPQAHVITTWPGAGAEDVEEAITRKIENQLSTLGGMSSMTSVSENSYSIVRLEFRDGTDVYGRLPEIRELLNSVRPDLPDDIDGDPEILISEANSLIPIFSARVDSTADPVELSRFIDDTVEPRLARIPGVARINVVGAAEDEVAVRLDVDRARARGITPLAVQRALGAANTDLPAGETRYRGRELALTSEGSFESIGEINDLVVGSHDGRYVRLGDIATVGIGEAEPMVVVRSEGRDTVVVDILKRDDGNTIEIVAEAQRILDEIAEENPGVFTWRTISDHRDMTNRSINTVVVSALLGTLLATLIILFFLHDIRATVIVGVSIPLSVLFAFGAMYLSGRTINVLTLSGITVAIGMIVDASIVSLENIWKHYDRQSENGQKDRIDRKLAAQRGTGEVGSAILASTLTSVSVFLPLAFLSGIIGIILSDLSLTIVFALVAAAIVAVVVVPFLSSVLLQEEHHRRKHKITQRIDTAIDSLFFRIRRWYQRALTRALGDTRFVLLTATAILVTSVLLVTILPVSFLPPTDTGEFELYIETPRTFSLEQTRQIVDEIDRVVAHLVPEIETGVYYVGAGGSLVITGAHNEAYGRIRLVPQSQRDRSVHELIPLVQQTLDQRIPEADVTVLNGGFDALLGLATEGQGYQIEVFGTRLEDVVAVAQIAYEHLSTDPEVLKAETNTSFNAEQLYIALSQKRMGDLGVSSYEAGITSRILINGITIGSYTAGEERIPIRLSSHLENQPIDSDTLHAIYLMTAGGSHVSFAAFSELLPRRTVSQINKRDRAISATVRGYLYSEDQSGVALRMEGMLNSRDLPPGIGWRRAGTSELIVDSMKSLSTVLAIAIFLVYVVMVIQFERYLQPLIIMAAIPFCLIGVVLGLLVFSSALSIVAMLGLITLGGTVVNNAIVMVDYINTLRNRDGISLEEATILGASDRLRPILMTTMTTLLAVMPMALSVGNGSELYAPLGQAIFGGLLTSTAITLFVVPALYREIEGWRDRRGSTPAAASVPAGPSTPPKEPPPRPTTTRAALPAVIVIGALLLGLSPEPVFGQSRPLGSNTTGRTIDALRDQSVAEGTALQHLLTFAEPFTSTIPGSFSPGDSTNHSIAIQRAQLEAARAERAAAVARRFPTVTASADAAWIANPTDPVALQPGELGTIPLSQIDPRVPDTILPNEETELFESTGWSRYELGVSVTQPIFAWGTIENAIDAATAAERVSAARLAGSEYAVTIEIAATVEYIAILDAIAQILAIQTDAADRLVEISRENWDKGFIQETEYLDAELARREVRLTQAEVAERRGNAEERLQILTGKEGPDTAHQAIPIDRPPLAGTVPESVDTLVQRALSGNWELHVIGAAEDLRRAGQRIARGSQSLRPDLGLQIDLSWVGALEDAGEASWDERGTWQMTIGVGLSTTLFDGGRSSADLRKAEAESIQATLEHSQREKTITAAVRNHLRRIETLRARMEYTVVEISVLEREIDNARSAMEAGIGDEATVLRTIIDYTAAIAEGYNHLSAYRTELWNLSGLLGSEGIDWD